MTFSILARDPDSGAIGGAAATGSLCVGGWVLRGALDAGMSASQGAAPSVFWGEDLLTRMRAGDRAADAVAAVTGADSGRAARQLAGLDPTGGTGAHTGADNIEAKGDARFDTGIASGNLLRGLDVLDCLIAGYLDAPGSFAERLIAGLAEAERAGGDSRGLMSAALLVLHPDRAPLTLRIDYHADDPVGALRDLHDRATSGDYGAWVRQVPSPSDRERVLD